MSLATLQPNEILSHALRHLVGHAYSPASSFWSGRSTLAPCVGHSSWVRTPWFHVSLVTSVVCRCVLVCVANLIWCFLCPIGVVWCGLLVRVPCGRLWCLFCHDGVAVVLLLVASFSGKRSVCLCLVGACRRLCPFPGGSPYCPSITGTPT